MNWKPEKREKWGSKKLLNEFPSKDRSRSRLYSLLRQIDATGSLTKKLAADVICGREHQSITTKVEELILQSKRCSQPPQKSKGNWAIHWDCKKFRCGVDWPLQLDTLTDVAHYVNIEYLISTCNIIELILSQISQKSSFDDLLIMQ